MARLHTVRRTQLLPISPAEAWEFFSQPDNLSKVSPDYLKIHIKSVTPGDHIVAGSIITYKAVYRFNQFLRLPLPWVTEITHVQKPFSFTDEQRFGPFKFWHHTHLFHHHEEGVLMEDILHYAMRWGLLGQLAHSLSARKRIEEIFDFRFHTLEELFKEKSTNSASKIL